MKFPVLRINDLHIRKFRSLAELRLMSQKYFELRGFCGKGTFFIDLEGVRYDLINVKRIRRSLNPIRWFRPSLAILVDSQVGTPTQLTLDEVKKTVCDLVVKNGWYRQGEQSAPGFRSMINSANSFVEIVEKISFYGRWQG